MTEHAPPHTSERANAGLVLENVTARYAGLVEDAVHDVSLHIAPRHIVALTGPSGCGKSTLLRAIAGLHPLTSGTVMFNGEDLTRRPTHKRDFGLMFQDAQLFGHLGVGQNVAYGLAAKRLGRSDKAQRVAEMLQLVGLDGFEHRGVNELSGGQRQRVALARSLAPAPRLLMLDEPFASLDETLRASLGDNLVSVLHHTNTTALFVTHDTLEANRLSDRVLTMRDGRIAQ